MRGFIRTWFAHYKRRSFTGRFILTACAVVVSTILAVGLASYQLYKSSFDQEIMSFHFEVLSHVKSNFETSVLGDTKKTVDSLLTESTTKNTLFQLLPERAAPQSVVEVRTLLSNKAAIAYPMIDSLNVYGIKSTTMVSNLYGVYYTGSDNRAGWVRDLEWILDFLASGRREAWLPMRTLVYDKNAATPKNVLTYVRILAHDRNEPLGILWINIDETRLRERLADIAGQGHGDILLVSGDGTIASCADAGRLYEDLSEEKWFRAMVQGVQTQIADVDGSESVISALRSDYTDLYYVYMADISHYYQKSAMLTRTILALCIVIMAVGVASWLLLSRRMVKPFSQVVQRARELQVLGGQTPPEGDLGVLSSTIDTLYIRSQKLAHTIAENQALVSSTLLAGLLYGHFADAGELQARLSGSGICFTKSHFTVLVMQPSVTPAAQPGDELEYMLDSIHKYLKTHFPATLPQQIDGERLALLANTGDDAPAYCEGLIAALSLFMREEFDISVCFGLGSTVQSLSQVRESCAQACEAVQYHILEPQVTLWDYEQIQARHTDDMVLVEHVQACTRTLREGGENALEAIRALHALLCETASVAIFLTVRSLMADAVASIYKSLGIGEHGLAGAAGPEALRGIRYLPTLFTELEGVCRALTAFKKERYSDAGAHYVERAQQYIQSHYDEPIQLESMAARLYISPPYLSRIFKKITGENFTEYLTRIRMEKARLLFESGSHPVAKVAELVGFPDIHYFRRKYRAFYGESPGKNPKR